MCVCVPLWLLAVFCFGVFVPMGDTYVLFYIRYEPEIAKFVNKHGAALGIPNSPCTAEQKKWEDIADQRRKQ